jgi:hypothetical protein
MDKRDKLGVQNQQAQQQSYDIGGSINAGVYEGLKGGLELGLGVLRGMSVPFALFSALGRGGDYFPLPGTYGLDDSEQVNVNSAGEAWRYRIGTGLGVLTDAAFAAWAVTGGLETKEQQVLAGALIVSNVGGLCYEVISALSTGRTDSRRRKAISTRKGVGAPKLRE